MVSQGGRRLPGWPLLLLLTLLLSSRSSEEEKETDSFSDVCATCHANATCQQKDGKNVCICNYGFVGNGRTYCQDKDECQIGTEKICGNHTSCHNTYGSFYCVCLEGFQASSKNKIFIPNDGTNCIDIDECEVSDICGPGARCVNTMGSFECYCMEGYQVENGTEPFHSIASKASCKVVNCGIPPSIPNAYFAPVNKTTYGSKVIYTCQPGYVFESGNWTSVCNTRQQWEGADIVCKEITCGQPPLISDSDMKWNGMSGLRSVVEYKCRKGFYPKGIKHHSLCTRNGTWEILDLRCEKVQEFADIKINGSCLSWRRHYGNMGVNETYQLTMRMLGSNKTTNMLIVPPATDEAVNVCLQLHQDANYTVKIYAKSSEWILTLRIIQPVVEKKIGFSNISIFNDTCIKWDRESGRTQSEETYIFHIQGLRWYQKQFYHKVTLNFTTNSQTPEMCLQLPPGSNYTVNISTANLDHSILLYMTTQITDPQSPEIEFISVQGSLPSLHLRKAEERNGPISSYQAIVIPWSSQCSFNCYSLTSLTYFGKGTDSDGYVAAEFPAYVIDDDRLKFALGDRLYYGKYYNAPLKQGKDYCIILRTVSEWNGVRTQSCVIWAQIKDLSSPPQHLTVVILGSIAAFGSILFLLFCIACTAVPTSPAELAKRQFLHKTGHLSITISTGEQSAASSSVIRLFLFSNAHIYQSCGRGNTIRRGNQWLSSSS
ncbi:sushi domain-containing protein 1 isoform X2 [Sceloporus undulatus]|uniref:sushi domain-containing protein 1 isoform X2 n=1 Tax=Sceloporus undulatus TaxID=8520 RepID=UPI001C4B097F|nr:sushi domain-containing protein 1 isoform X2 [Sceloporus undulatus]